MFKKLLMTSSSLSLIISSLSLTSCTQVQTQVLSKDYLHPNLLETLYFSNEMEKALIDFKGLNEPVVDHTHSLEIGDKSQAFRLQVSSQVAARKILSQQELILVNQTAEPMLVSELSNNFWLTLEQKQQIVPAHSQIKQLVQIQQIRKLVRYHYLVPIENDQWCKKITGASGKIYQITPRELVEAVVNDSELLEYYLGEKEFYQYKDFIGKTESEYLVWAATNVDIWEDETEVLSFLFF